MKDSKQLIKEEVDRCKRDKRFEEIDSNIIKFKGILFCNKLYVGKIKIKIEYFIPKKEHFFWENVFQLLENITKENDYKELKKQINDLVGYFKCVDENLSRSGGEKIIEIRGVEERVVREVIKKAISGLDKLIKRWNSEI